MTGLHASWVSLFCHQMLCVCLSHPDMLHLRAQSQSILANVNKDDGADALVNAILVARGDALPTQFAGNSERG